jgi:Nucleoside-diphosphate-sugar epimerases
MASKILITGATGFVGQAVVDACLEQGLDWIGQTSGTETAKNFRADLSAPFDWNHRLRGIDTIVHLAGMAHVPVNDEQAKQKMRRVNVDATAILANHAVNSGVRHFVFVSSVNSYLYERSLPGASYYGYSKKMAEEAILEEATGSGMAVTILRPCLMYGKGAKGNFSSMLRWLWRGVPLPLGSVRNRRSFMHVRNFADIILHSISAREKAAGVFEVTDGIDYSTPDLLLKVGMALGKPARLIPFPTSLLRLGATVAGKKDMLEKLAGDMAIDGSKLATVLNWQRKYADADGFKEMALDFTRKAFKN